MAETDSDTVLHDVPPYLKVYKNGTVERFLGTDAAPPGLHPLTGVSSKDVVIHPETGVSVRLYRPNAAANHQSKLPLVVYFHGGAFCISSTADPLYHEMLNILVKEANIILVSVDYRLAPENPLPAAYEDSSAALRWLAAAHTAADGGAETWLKQYADFDRVFLAGDSAGANICHHLGLKTTDLGGLNISGILMIQPYFWGEKPIGVEAENPIFKSVVDKWWLFVCPSELGCDDPLINPFVAGAADISGLATARILVCVAGNDILRERGKLYYETLLQSKWKGKAEVVETTGEDHVFHIINPNSENSRDLFKRCAEFINAE